VKEGAGDEGGRGEVKGGLKPPPLQISGYATEKTPPTASKY